MPADLDIVIPVYNEGPNILATLGALAGKVKTPARVLICYDRPDDNTLPVVRGHPQAYAGLAVELVRNPGRGAHAAIMTGLAASTAPFVVVSPHAPMDLPAGWVMPIVVEYLPVASAPAEELLLLETSSPVVDRRPITLVGTP